MVRYVFLGRVLPERANFVLFQPRRIELRKLDGAIYCVLVVAAESSQVQVIAECSAEEDLATLRNNVTEGVQVLLDAFGFRKGFGYGLEITTCTDEAGNLSVFGVGIPCLQSGEGERALSFEESLDVCTRAQAYRLALADARSAIREASNSAFYCYRAIESLRHHFLRPGEDEERVRSDTWTRLRANLNLERSYIDAVKDVADGRRHGALTGITGEQRADVLTRTWKILDRFGLFVRLGGDSLPVDRFPTLT